MSEKTRKCHRCGKLWRGQDGWNADYVAGLEVGVLCPDCQTAEEYVAAEVNLIDSPAGSMHDGRISNQDDLVAFINMLIAIYPQPEVMRAKAEKLGRLRSDVMARQTAALMLRLAEDMESGEIYED